MRIGGESGRERVKSSVKKCCWRGGWVEQKSGWENWKEGCCGCGGERREKQWRAMGVEGRENV